jgi:hypothetical protein
MCAEVAALATFTALSPEQAAGQACVVGLCRVSFVSVDGEPAPASVVVGRAKSTGEDVRACADSCARLVGWVPRSGWIQPEH